METEIMYNASSVVIVLSLFLAMMLCNQAGYKLGSRSDSVNNKEFKSQTAAIQTGVMGLLALLLGFTFNMSLQRFDARSQAVIAESGAISSAALHAQMLPGDMRKQALSQLAEYTALRVEISAIDLSEQFQRQKINERISDAQQKLFELLEQSNELTNLSPSIRQSLMQALVKMVEAENKRSAMLRLHVPEPVLFLLFVVFLTAGGMLGYTSGLGRKRPKFPTLIMSVLIVVVVFIIIDLDRPKRGIIKVNQSGLTDVQHLIERYQRA